MGAGAGHGQANGGAAPVGVGAGLGQAAFVQHGNAVAQGQYFVQIVGNQQHGSARIACGDQLLLHKLHGANIEPPRGLVRHDQARGGGGLAMLAGLMGLAFYNDILRLVT